MKSQYRLELMEISVTVALRSIKRLLLRFPFEDVQLVCYYQFKTYLLQIYQVHHFFRENSLKLTQVPDSDISDNRDSHGQLQ